MLRHRHETLQELLMREAGAPQTKRARRRRIPDWVYYLLAAAAFIAWVWLRYLGAPVS